MPIIQKTIKTCVRPNTIKKYRDHGIKCNVNDIIEIPINYLSNHSHVLLDCKCDICNKNLERQYRDCLKKKDILCDKCFPSLLGKSKKDDSFLGKKFGRLTILERSSKVKHLQKVKCICDCGKKIEAYLTNIKRGTTKSCGCYFREVFGELQEKTKRRGGIISVTLAKNCHKKCNFKCIVCSSSKNLVAHHLNSWKFFPKDRFKQNNLITMCSKCHIEYHKNTWIKFVTKENFKEYLKKCLT